MDLESNLECNHDVLEVSSGWSLIPSPFAPLIQSPFLSLFLLPIPPPFSAFPSSNFVPSVSFSAGESRSAVIHRYCVQEDEKLADRFRRIRSVGRSLTLYFSTDSSVTRKGFSLQFAFVSPELSTECGFNANSLNGTIQSPAFPADYPPNSQCVWDVQVPMGFHLLLTFEYFDIAQSVDCSRDFLRVLFPHFSWVFSFFPPPPSKKGF